MVDPPERHISYEDRVNIEARWLERQRRLKERQSVLARLFVVLTLLGATAAIGIYIAYTTTVQVRQKVRDSVSMNAVQKATISELEQRLEAALQLRSEEEKIEPSEKSIHELLTRIKLLEDSIQKSPESVLSIPLLRKDIESNQKLAEKNQESVRVELDRLHVQYMWIQGGIAGVFITLSLGALTWAIRAFWKAARHRMSTPPTKPRFLERGE